MRPSSMRRDTTPGVARPATAPAPSALPAPGVFAELLRLVEWRDPLDHRRSCGALERTHLESVIGRVNGWLAPKVREQLDELPDEAYLALARSPELFHAAFFRPRGQLDAAMLEWIAVARAQVGASTHLDGVATSATWDRVVIARAGRVVSIDRMPRLAHGPLLDFTSELPNRLITRFPERALVPPDAVEQSITADKLEVALDVLRAVSPLAYALVHDMIQVISARSAVDDLRFYTASDATTLGVVHLANTHLQRKTAPEIASELVHEAIHQALFRWELHQPLLADPSAATAKVRSPWTGAVLDVYAFVHACFVWYGVASLWRLAEAPNELAVVRQRRAAEAGFDRDPLACLGQHRKALSPSLRAVIAEMTARMRS